MTDPSIEWVLGECERIATSANREGNEAVRGGASDYTERLLRGTARGANLVADAIEAYRAEHPSPAPQRHPEPPETSAGETHLLPMWVLMASARRYQTLRAIMDACGGVALRRAYGIAMVYAEDRDKNWVGRKIAESMTIEGAIDDAANEPGIRGVLRKLFAEAERPLPGPQWSADWPTEPGWYWLCSLDEAGVVSTEVVHAVRLHSGGTALVKREGGDSVHPDPAFVRCWLPATVPDPPQLEPTKPPEARA